MTYAQNRKARFDYEFLETFEAGIVLEGAEVKSVRDGKVSLKESYVKISVRAPKPLEKKIKRGEMPSITSFLIELSSALGGFADGHPVAASAVIPRDKINIFLERIDLHIQKNL